MMRVALPVHEKFNITKMMKYKKILVIDDRREVRLLISTCLRNLPYDVIEATCGEEGLAILEIKQPDLILLDILMPGGMDGLAVCRRIKKRTDWAMIPVVIMTTMGQMADRSDAFLAGADEYIVKPFSVEIFLKTIRQFLDGVDV
jgi:CheY-like chemotaxis protein